VLGPRLDAYIHLPAASSPDLLPHDRAGTNPRGAASALHFVSATKEGNDFVFSFPTATNRLYVVEWTTELTSGVWTSLPDVIEGDGTVLQVTHVGGAALPQRFYRIRLIY